MPDAENPSQMLNTTGFEVYVKFAALEEGPDADAQAQNPTPEPVNSDDPDSLAGPDSQEVDPEVAARLTKMKVYHLFYCESRSCESMEDLHEIQEPFAVKDPKQKAEFDAGTQFYVLYGGKTKALNYKLELTYELSLAAMSRRGASVMAMATSILGILASFVCWSDLM